MFRVEHTGPLREQLVKARVLTKVINQIATEVDLGLSTPEVLQQIRPQLQAPRSKKWYFQFFKKNETIQGELDYDPCVSYVPEEVRKLMARTKMMQLRIPEELHKWFKTYAQDNDVTMTLIFISYLERLRMRSRKEQGAKQI